MISGAEAGDLLRHCFVEYRFVKALLGIEMALNGSGEAGISGARAMVSDEQRRQSTVRRWPRYDEQSMGKARMRLAEALNSNATSGRATALNSKPVEWQSIGTGMYSFGIARH